MNEARPFDVVVFGATGFTGGLVAEYLASCPDSTRLRWAIAGRDLAKLAQVRERVAVKSAMWNDLPLLVADVDDAASLARLCAQTRVVITTVGPFARYGEALVRACVEAKTDYVDITGEPNFVDDMIAKYDEQARAAGIRIVNCCGFDSIPHDLGALFTRRLLPRDRPVQIEGFVRADGDVSGGTWNSALDIAEHGMPKTKQKRPPQADGRRVGSTRSLPRYSRTLHGWAVPLATIDPVVVKRSARALPEYGPDFRYGHFALGRSFARTALTTLAVASALTLATVKPVREKMRQFKKPGTGPSAEKRAKSFFEVTFVGRCGSQRVFTKVSGGDPGYTETSKMVSEAALALAFDRDTLPTGTGVVTPAVGLGDALLTRLQRAGIRFEQVDRV